MGMITIAFPRKCPGDEILVAFRNSSTFKVSENLKWVAVEYESENGEVSPDSTYRPQKGIYATLSAFEERGRIARRLFGVKPGKWSTQAGLGAKFLTQIRLYPISQSTLYKSVLIDVHHEYNPDLGGGFQVARTPDDAAFSPFRPAYDKIIQGLLQRLQ